MVLTDFQLMKCDLSVLHLLHSGYTKITNMPYRQRVDYLEQRRKLVNHQTPLAKNKMHHMRKFVLLPGILLLNHILLSTLHAEENFSLPGLQELTPSKKGDYSELPNELPQICEASAHFIATKKPSTQFTRITTDLAWSAFTQEHVGKSISKKEWDSECKVSLKVDFTKQQVLVFFADPKQSAQGFSDIEIYEFNGALKAFVFHYEGSGHLNLLPKNTVALGTYYVAVMPKHNYLVAPEFHFAAQSWGRECSDFYPPFKITLLNDYPAELQFKKTNNGSANTHSDPTLPQSNG